MFLTSYCGPFSLAWKKSKKFCRTCPSMFLASKKGARQTKLTTALWYWQHCCWHHQSRRFVKNPLLVPTKNCNSTFLLRGTTPRDVTWQNFRHGKIISRKNSSSFKFPSWKEKKELFLKLQFFLLMGDFFWMFVVGEPFPHKWLPCPLPCFNLHWQKAKLIQWQDFGHTLNWPRLMAPKNTQCQTGLL